MSQFKAIRKLLRATQEEIGAAIGCTQTNVSYYERGQTVPPQTAKRLLEFAASRGVRLTYDHVYGGAPLPAPPTVAPISLEA